MRWRRCICAGAGRQRGPHSSGTFRGRTRIGFKCVRGDTICFAGCSQTICWRSSSSAIAGTSSRRQTRNWAPRSRLTGRARSIQGALHDAGIGADRGGLRPDSGCGCRPATGRRSRTIDRNVRPRQWRDGRRRCRSARLHQGDSRTARGDRPRADTAARSTRPIHIRADWGALAVGARKLRRNRIGNRQPGRSCQRETRGAGRRAADSVLQTCTGAS